MSIKITESTDNLYTHELKGNEKYIFGKRCCYNLKTHRAIKMQYSNGLVGYKIDGRFKSVNQLRIELVKIKKIEECPF
jgi:hypothetical protein